MDFKINIIETEISLIFTMVQKPLYVCCSSKDCFYKKDLFYDFYVSYTVIIL